MSEQKDDTKLKSRKFAVWIVWLVLTIAVIIFSVVGIFVSKTMADSLTGLIEKVLGWFFAVSMMYLGVNVGQKAALAFSEVLQKKEEEGDEEEC